MGFTKLPRSLLSYGAFDTLCNLLLEKDAARQELKMRDFGPRVKTLETAQGLLDKISETSRQVLDLDGVNIFRPELVLTQRLTRLPWATARLYLFYLAVSCPLLYLIVTQPAQGPTQWAAFLGIVMLLIAPLLIHRRARINIEHECRYVRKSDGKATIYIDQLRSIQFQSYLAHEYAHHLYYEHFAKLREEWIREGWARLVQWQVMEVLSQEENNPAFLHHVLNQIIGEIKLVCLVLSMALHMRLPTRVKRVRSIYHLNPLYRLLTGTPSFNMQRYTEHAIGTASYFLLARQAGFKWALHGLPNAEEGEPGFTGEKTNPSQA